MQVTACTGHLEEIGSLSCVDLPYVDALQYTI